MRACGQAYGTFSACACQSKDKTRRAWQDPLCDVCMRSLTKMATARAMSGTGQPTGVTKISDQRSRGCQMLWQSVCKEGSWDIFPSSETMRDL